MTKEAKQPTAAELAEQWKEQAETHRDLADLHQRAAESKARLGQGCQMELQDINVLVAHHQKQAEAAERTAERFERDAEKPKNSTT